MLKKVICILILIVLIFSISGCGEKTLTWQEQYDLGCRYLSDGNYEEAIIAFNAAIKIDSKRPEAYLQVAYTYIEMNDYEAAKNILQSGYEQTGDETLNKKLAEIESGTFTDYMGRDKRMSHYDGDGNLLYYLEYSYYGLNKDYTVTSYDYKGNRIGEVEVTYDKEGNQLSSYGCLNSGELIKCEYEYDSKGRMIGEKLYDENGELNGSNKFEYDSNGRRIGEKHYAINGDVLDSWIFEYDLNGRQIGVKSFDRNGELFENRIFEYDSNGRTVGYKCYNKNDVLTCVWIYEYDENGNGIGSKEYDGNGNLISSYEYN